ncbi:MAG: flagellum-specific ATP synthase FliI, partial [Burkholderiales bacterium]|nr:flagellum-specific ATP synthase FliI [Burkholderiales bacterium]
MPQAQRIERWQQFLADLQQHASEPQPLEPAGKLTRVAGLVLEATGLNVPVGTLCEIQVADAAEKSGVRPARAEVVGFNGDRAFLMPTDELHGLVSGASVRARSTPPRPPL